MKFSIFGRLVSLGSSRPSPARSQPMSGLVEVAKLTDYAGQETLFAPDHLTTIPPSHERLFEAWSLITGPARETSRVRLDHLVPANRCAPCPRRKDRPDYTQRQRVPLTAGSRTETSGKMLL